MKLASLRATPFGSLYVWPGCTFTGYAGYDYSGGQEYHGPYEGFTISPAPPNHMGDGTCPNG